MNREINTDMTVGVFGLALTSVFFFSIEDVSWLSTVFPQTMVAILAVISVALIVKGFVRPTRTRIFSEGSNARWLVTGALFFLWVILIPFLGFFVCTVVFMTAIVVLLARGRVVMTPARLLVWFLIVATEVAFFYLVFSRLLYVPLPEGLLF